MKLDWLTDDGVNISWDNGVVDAPQEFLDNVDFLVDAKVRVRSPRFYFAEEVAGMDTMVGALLTVEFLLDVLGVGLVEVPMPFGESDVFVTDNHDVFDGEDAIEKAMSRSEAGKYAAEQRWKNHAKKGDAVRVLDPRYQKVADRINAGTKSVTDAGFRIDLIMDQESYSEAFEAHAKTRHALIAKVKADNDWNVRDGFELVDKIFKWNQSPPKIDPENSRQKYIIAVWDKDVLAGAVSINVYPSQKKAYLDMMGSTQVVKGAGSAMYGHILKWGKSIGIEEYILSPLDTAKSFWSGEMGMIWDGSNMIYADGKIGMIGALK